MSNYFSGTFNTISQAEETFGSGMAVWARVNKSRQSGGWVDTSKYSAGDLIPAGTPVIYTTPGAEVKVVDTTSCTKADLAKVNGLTENDVRIPSGVVEATCAVVIDGRIYANRANGGNGLPASLQAQLPAIEFVYEGEAPAEPTA